MKLFAKLVNDWKLLNIFGKSFILDVWLGSVYASGDCTPEVQLLTEWDTSRDLVPVAQLLKREKHRWVFFTPRVFFTFLKLYKWYQIV